MTDADVDVEQLPWQSDLGKLGWVRAINRGTRD